MNKVRTQTEAEQINQLINAQHNVTKKNGLTDFTREVRTNKNDLSGKYSVTLNRVNKLFTDTVWVEQTTKNGHKKFEHAITKIVVEYSNHSSQVDPGAVQEIFNQVQEHLDIIKREIFVYKNNTPKAGLDLDRSLQRWNQRLNNA